MEEITNFFNTELEVYTRLEDAYHIGVAVPQPVVIVFQTMHDKNVVFEQKKKLKDTSANDGVNYYLNHYLPSFENEKRKRERRIKADYKEAGTDVDISYGKGGLQIDSKPYKKMVAEPDPTDLLKCSCQELDEIMKISTKKGPEIKSKGSAYIAYSIDTNEHSKVRDAYLKVRLQHARARHIICAYNLKGPEKEIHQYRDFCDEQEPGGGSYLLSEMIRCKISSKAFFVVRYCGEEKLGDDRLKMYTNAAEALLRLHPHNQVLDEDQHFTSYKTRQHKNKGNSVRGRKTGK